MLSSLSRKGRQLAEDPVLRRWLVLRALGRTPAPPRFAAHCPLYLGPLVHLGSGPPVAPFPAMNCAVPSTPLILRLPGAAVTAQPGQAWDTLEHGLPDLETRLGLHRFAWVPLMATGDDPGWVADLWSQWMERHGDDAFGDWPWHPYTAAERAINILTFAARHGLPGSTGRSLVVLSRHAEAIVKGLEWFGDHHTSNHCFNNGRGLYLLGAALGLDGSLAAGRAIVTHEARRIFAASGVLREASTHYHLLLTRSLASLWLTARRHGLAQDQALFHDYLVRAMAVLPHFRLAGGMPLMGDISPDCPPSHLAGLLPGGDLDSGWSALLPEDERRALGQVRDGAEPVAGACLAANGWMRGEFGSWSGLWHAEPSGWSPMPGHGHQDCGAPELHFDGQPLFIDPGRGSYALAGEADPFVAAGSHGGLTVDGENPYPSNRPYYSPDFRAGVAGGARLARHDDGVVLDHDGYARLGVGTVRRSWHFGARSMWIDDRVEGRGRHRIERFLVCAAAVEVVDHAAVVTLASGQRLRISADDSPATVTTHWRWTAYGEAAPCHRISFAAIAALPYTGVVRVEVL